MPDLIVLFLETIYMCLVFQGGKAISSQRLVSYHGNLEDSAKSSADDGALAYDSKREV